MTIRKHSVRVVPRQHLRRHGVIALQSVLALIEYGTSLPTTVPDSLRPVIDNLKANNIKSPEVLS